MSIYNLGYRYHTVPEKVVTEKVTLKSRSPIPTHKTSTDTGVGDLVLLRVLRDLSKQLTYGITYRRTVKVDS